ncbi:hypothetical protein ACH33_17725 [Aneurinibacillus sp. XH2]|nr:hypothetical protein ACH33_17725 [Aneurinibacillus sp. XH2]
MLTANKQTHIFVNQDELLKAWNRTLPSTFDKTDKVECTLLSIKRQGLSVEQTPDIHDLSKDYMRNTHECAQTLHPLANSQLRKRGYT